MPPEGDPYHYGKISGFAAKTGDPTRENVPVPPPSSTAGSNELPADRDLIDACLATAPGSWEAFLKRFGGLFAHVADRTARHRRTPLAAGDREDLVAEIMLECLRNKAAVLRSFAGHASLATYLTVIARRVTVRHLVKDFDAFRLPITDEPAADTALPQRFEDREVIEVLLERLDEAEARLVRLHHLEARSYSEISRLTGLPLGSIGPALSKARGKMRLMTEAPKTS